MTCAAPPARARCRLFRRANRRDHSRPAQVAAAPRNDRPIRRRRHQKRLALYRPSDKYRAMRGHPRHAEGRSFREGHVVGKIGHQSWRVRCIPPRRFPASGRCADRVEPDARAKPTLGHARTDLVDHPRAVTVRHDARILHRRRTTSPIRVRRVDAGGLSRTRTSP